MSQHFLLSAAARTLSLSKVFRMSDAEAYDTFKAVRWSANGGEPNCPHCGCLGVYVYTARRIFRCKDCGKQFSVTSGTIFASRKMAYRDILGAIAIFVNGAKGVSALQVSRDLDCQYKTAFVLCHKIREAMAAEQADRILSGEVEVDGAFFGGYIKPENKKADRKDRRLVANQTGKRMAVVVMRERGGMTVPFVAASEADAVEVVASRIANGTTVYADEASCWDVMHAKFDTKRTNHSVQFRDEDACTSQAESFFSRLRRAEIGTHHHISGKYLHQYAGEMAWREDHRRKPNGTLYGMVAAAAMAHPVSAQWKGYWQRSA